MPKKLDLKGFVTHIDEYGRVWIRSKDEESLEKLWEIQNNINGTGPITPNGFKLSIKNSKNIRDFEKLSPKNIRSTFVGSHVLIECKPLKYKFVSKLARNKGEVVVGFKLVITNLELV